MENETRGNRGGMRMRRAALGFIATLSMALLAACGGGGGGGGTGQPGGGGDAQIRLDVGTTRINEGEAFDFRVTVTDDAGHPIAGAQVSVTDGANLVISNGEGLTDENG